MSQHVLNEQTKVIADILGKTDIDDLLQSGNVKLDSNGNVTYVDLSRNGLTSLPEGVAAWTSATTIDLSDNNLTSLLTFLEKNQKRGLKIHSISIVGRSAKFTKLDVIRLYSYRTCIILHFLKVSLQPALSSLFYQNRCPIPG